MEIAQIVILAWVLVTDGARVVAALLGSGAPPPPPRPQEPTEITWIDPAQESEIPF